MSDRLQLLFITSGSQFRVHFGAERADWLLGHLWNCTDIVPADTRLEVRDWFPDSNEPFTYAALSRLLAQDLTERGNGDSQ